MAKDGTFRGGARPGSGPKKKPLAEKILTGNPGKRPLTIVDFSVMDNLSGETMPPPHEYIMAAQKDGKQIQAAEIYESTWNWLHERGCSHLVNPQIIELYAMSVARLIQCEQGISEFGFLAKHPTTGVAIQSPYVAMQLNFMKQANALWMQIYQVVRDNCSTEFKGNTPQDDAMERLLNTRKGK